MKYIREFTIIIVISFIGEILNDVLPLPIPAGIYGLFIMLFLLMSGLLKADSVKKTGGFLLETMPVMFIPAAAGLITIWDKISGIWIQLFVFAIISTIVTMAVTGLVTDRFAKKEEE